MLRAERVFLRAAADVYSVGDGALPHRRRHDARLARYYMWHQTPGAIHVAVYLPTGAWCTALRRRSRASSVVRARARARVLDTVTSSRAVPRTRAARLGRSLASVARSAAGALAGRRDHDPAGRRPPHARTP